MSSSSPVLLALRAATADRHHAVESLLGFDRELDRARYGRLLTGFAVFLRSWEPEILRHLPERLKHWFIARSRVPFLERDLRALGVQDIPGMRFAEALVLDGLPALYGSMYVLEGSALGGQVLAEQVRRQLGLDSRSGAAYFAGWEADTGRMWAEFRRLLAADVGDSPAAHDVACESAKRTFDVLMSTFRQVLADGPIPA